MVHIRNFQKKIYYGWKVKFDRERGIHTGWYTALYRNKWVNILCNILFEIWSRRIKTWYKWTSATLEGLKLPQRWNMNEERKIGRKIKVSSRRLEVSPIFASQRLKIISEGNKTQHTPDERMIKTFDLNWLFDSQPTFERKIQNDSWESKSRTLVSFFGECW